MKNSTNSLNLLLACVVSLITSVSFSQITVYPYIEDFEAGAAGWTVNGTTTTWALGIPSYAPITTAASGSNAWVTNLTGLYLNNENGWVQSPVFDFTAVANPKVQVSIYYYAETSFDGMVLQSSIDAGASWQNVGNLGDPGWYNNGSIWGNPGGQPIGWNGVPGSNGWVTVNHALTGLAGQSSVLLRFAFGSDGSVTYAGCAFDNITVFNETCPQPTALNASNILDTSADLGWTEAGTATTWNVEYGPAGFAQGTGTMITGTTSNPVNVTGLTANTSYSFYVQADCGGGDLSIWSGPFTFVTACATYTAPWVDDIETQPALTGTWTTSQCWSQTTPSSTSLYDWNVTSTGTTPSSGTGANSAHSGTHYFYTEASYGTSGVSTAVIESPNVDVSAIPTMPKLEFWYHMVGAQIGNLTTEVWDGSAWNQVDVMSGPQQAAQADPWLKKTIYLPGYTGIVKVRFTAVSAGTFAGDICIDDVSISAAPTCPEPSNFTQTGGDLSSVDLNWSPIGTETEWQFEYGPVGFTPGTGTIVPSYQYPDTINGLTANSFYQVYVEAVCSPGDTSVQVGPLTFNTYDQGLYMDWDNSCPVAGFTDISGTGVLNLLGDDGNVGVTLPFPLLYQGVLFSDATIGSNGGLLLGSQTLSLTWVNGTMAAAANGLYPFWDDLGPEQPGEGVFYQTIGTSPNQQFIVQWNKNELGGSGGTYIFQLIIDEATQDIYFVYDVIAVGDVGYDYGASATVGVAGPNQDLQVSYNNTSYLTGNSCAHFFYTDCPHPVNYSVIYTTNDEAGISWSAGLAGETNWTVIYGPAGFDPMSSGTSISVTSPSAIITGLNDITTYDVYIYADCNPGVLQSSGFMGQFTTLPNCSDVTGITTSTAIDSVFTSWNWTESSGVGTYPSTGFNLQYGYMGFNLFDTDIAIVNADNNYTDTTADVALLGGGVYQMYVQAVCNTDTSNWVGPITFTMPLTNDLTCDAIDLMVDGTNYVFNNAGATVSTGEAAIAPPATGFQTTTGWGNSTMSFTTWFTFTAPPSGNMWVDATGVNFDGQIAIYETTNCGNFPSYTLLAANDDALEGGSLAPHFSICGLTPGNQYYLVHDSYSTFTTGNYGISLSEIVLNAGATTGILNVCTGDTVNLYDGLAGNDAGGTWTEMIPTASFNDPYFPSAGLAYQVFDFQYMVVDGCAADSTMQQVQIYGPSSAGTDGTITVCKNQPVDLLSGLGGNVDLGGTWYDPSNNPMASSAISASNIPGQFNYDYITGNGVCPNDTANVVLNVSPSCDYLNIQEIYFGTMDVYPNPTTGMIYVSNEGSAEVFSYVITDVNGKEIASEENAINGTELKEISLKGLEPGIYMIRVHNDNAEKTFRIVKQ